MNLRVTDKEAKHNLEMAGGNLDQVKFVRNKNYMAQLSIVV
jgi:hypothetical protein